jgi:hypothetical protein
MQTDTLRMSTGFLIILSHLTSFALILLGGSLTGDERVELSLIIAPLFAAYVTAIVRKIATLAAFDRTPVHPAMTILGIGTAVVFGLAIPAIIWRFEAGGIDSFKDLKNVVGIAETALGIYTGAVIDRLFGAAAPKAGG